MKQYEINLTEFPGSSYKKPTKWKPTLALILPLVILVGLLIGNALAAEVYIYKCRFCGHMRMFSHLQQLPPKCPDHPGFPMLRYRQ